MNKEAFMKVLGKNKIHFMEEGERLIVGRINYSGSDYISFYELEIDSMPPNVTFDNSGHVQLGALKEIPEGVFFDNEGVVYMSMVSRITRGTRFGRWVRGVIPSGGVIDFDIREINYGDLLTAVFKYS
jgi:hypothetical protein